MARTGLAVAVLLACSVVTGLLLVGAAAGDLEGWGVPRRIFEPWLAADAWYPSAYERAELALLNMMRLDPGGFRDHFGLPTNIFRTKGTGTPAHPLWHSPELARSARFHAWDMDRNAVSVVDFCWKTGDCNNSVAPPWWNDTAPLHDFVSRLKNAFDYGWPAFEALVPLREDDPMPALDAVLCLACGNCTWNSTGLYYLFEDCVSDLKAVSDRWQYFRDEFRETAAGMVHKPASVFAASSVFDFGYIRPGIGSPIVVGAHTVRSRSQDKMLFLAVWSDSDGGQPPDDAFLIVAGSRYKLTELTSGTWGIELEVSWNPAVCQPYVFMFLRDFTVLRYPEKGVLLTWMADVNAAYCDEEFRNLTTPCPSGGCGNGTCFDGDCVCRSGWRLPYCAEGCGDGVIQAGEVCETYQGPCCSNCTQILPAGVLCANMTGLCSYYAFCDGASGYCPSNIWHHNHQCWWKRGDCDYSAFCDGFSADCPHLHGNKTLCRPAVNILDHPEYCTGTSPWCPYDQKDSYGFWDMFPPWLLGICVFFTLNACCLGCCFLCCMDCFHRPQKVLNKQHYDGHGNPTTELKEIELDHAPETKEEAQDEARVAWLRDQERRREERLKRQSFQQRLLDEDGSVMSDMPPPLYGEPSAGIVNVMEGAPVDGVSEMDDDRFSMRSTETADEVAARYARRDSIRSTAATVYSTGLEEGGLTGGGGAGMLGTEDLGLGIDGLPLDFSWMTGGRGGGGGGAGGAAPPAVDASAPPPFDAEAGSGMITEDNLGGGVVGGGASEMLADDYDPFSYLQG